MMGALSTQRRMERTARLRNIDSRWNLGLSTNDARSLEIGS
jgi:hypothetical protein